MAKKRLLSEAQVRRFMGLAGMDVKLSSNLLKEVGMYEEEPVADEEFPPEDPAMDAGAEAGEEELGEPAGELPVEEPAEVGGEVELSPEDIKGARASIEKLLAPLEAKLPDEGEEGLGGEEELGGEEAELAPEPEVAVEPVAPEGEEEEVIAEALSGINLELGSDELIQEVAKRVARRLLRAKKAQKQLNEALGRKK